MEAIIGASVGAFLLMLAIVGFLVYVRGEKEVKRREFNGGEIAWGINKNGKQFYQYVPYGSLGNEESFGESQQVRRNPLTGRMVIIPNSSRRKQRRRRSRKSKRV